MRQHTPRTHARRVRPDYVAPTQDNYNYNYHKNNNQPYSNSPENLVSQPIDNDNQNESTARRPDGLKVGTYAQISAKDPDFCYVKKFWGMHPGILVNAMKALGVKKVREILKTVREMGDFRFDKRNCKETVMQARGRYCRGILINEAMVQGKAYTDERGKVVWSV